MPDFQPYHSRLPEEADLGLTEEADLGLTEETDLGPTEVAESMTEPEDA